MLSARAAASVDMVAALGCLLKQQQQHYEYSFGLKKKLCNLRRGLFYASFLPVFVVGLRFELLYRAAL